MCGGEVVRADLFDLRRLFWDGPMLFVLVIGGSMTKDKDRLPNSDMMDPGRRDIRPNPGAFDLAAIQSSLNRFADALQPRATGTGSHQRFHPTNEHVFQEGQAAAWREEAPEQAENALHF